MKIINMEPSNKAIISKNSSQPNTEEYINHLVGINALASNNIKDPNFNLHTAVDLSTSGLETLKTPKGLQNMLSAQMVAIHELQQTTMAMAQGVSSIEHQKYYINSAVKLANAFTAQANLLAKLQGATGQKIIVERVDIQNGGQAIVGNINSRQDIN